MASEEVPADAAGPGGAPPRQGESPGRGRQGQSPGRGLAELERQMALAARSGQQGLATAQPVPITAIGQAPGSQRPPSALLSSGGSASPGRLIPTPQFSGALSSALPSRTSSPAGAAQAAASLGQISRQPSQEPGSPRRGRRRRASQRQSEARQLERNRQAQQRYRARQRQSLLDMDLLSERITSVTALNEAQAQRSTVLELALELQQTLESTGLLTLVTGDAVLTITLAELQQATPPVFQMLWQDFTAQLAAHLQETGSQALLAPASLRVLGQAMGLCLCLSRVNPALVLQLVGLRLDNGAQLADQPLAEDHWLRLLELVQLRPEQAEEMLALHAAYLAEQDALDRVVQHSMAQLQATLPSPQALTIAAQVQAGYLGSALEATGRLQASLNQQSELLLGRIWLLQHRTLDMRQVAIMVVHSAPSFPDALGLSTALHDLSLGGREEF